MMFGSELPSWKQLIGMKKENKESYWSDKDIIWTYQSGISIKLILEKYMEYYQKENVEIWIPEYFCVETESIFCTNKVRLTYYPINENLEPCWDKLKDMSKAQGPEIFLFVHYFGVYHDVNKARTFCDRFNALLIEDCAHVLYNYGKFGAKADFTIYSPHKILPVPDGAVIYYNKNKENVCKIAASIKNELAAEDICGQCFFWRMKKAVQKLLKYRKKEHLKIGLHIGARTKPATKKKQISKWSYQILNEYTYEALKEIAHMRNMNLRTMNHIMRQISEDIIPEINEDTECPYVAVYSLKNVKNRQEAVDQMENMGLFVNCWPKLSATIKKSPYAKTAFMLSENYIVIPIHQGMTPQLLLKKYSSLGNARSNHVMLKELSNTKQNKELWEKLPVENANIPQDWVYGEKKAICGKDRLKRYAVYKDKQLIGLVQALIKIKLGIPIAVRVNRGPVFIKEYNSAENAFETLRMLRKSLRLPLLYFWAPNLEFSPENMKLASRYGWRCWKSFGFPSGIIDLTKSEQEIRRQLHSKWRNQLKTAENQNLNIINNNDIYIKLLDIYAKDQREKQYEGVPDILLKSLFQKRNSPLEAYYILDNKKEPIAFDIIYRQKGYAHYLAGWNSCEGRKMNLNNLLLYNAAIDLKNKGISRFDLGGIDYVHTEDIAKFKEGMGGTFYQLLGEMVK